MATIIIIPTHLTYGGTEVASKTRIRTRSRYAGRVIELGVGAIPAGESGRKVFQGPLVEGPWAYTYPLGTMITAHPQPERAPVIDVAIGDLIEVDGVTYRLTDDSRWEYPALEPVA